MAEHHPTPPHPDPHAKPNPSFNIEVPYSAHGHQGSSYFRVGAPDPSSKRETDYFAHAEEAPEPGILMISPHELVQVAESEVKVTTSAEELAVVTAGNKVIKAEYCSEEGGTFRETTFTYARETAWTMGDAQSFKLASETDVSITNDQKLSLAAGFSMSMGLETEITCGPLSIEINHHGTEVKSELLHGEYTTSKHRDVEGGEALTLTLNPMNAAYLGRVQTYVATLKALGGVLAGLIAAGFGAQGLLLTKSFTPGELSHTDVEYIKKRLVDLGTVAKVELGTLSTLQVAAGLLGPIALSNRAVAAANPLLPKIEMTATGIKLSVGPTNALEISATGVSITSGALSSVSMSPASITASAPAVTLQSSSELSSISCNNAVATLTGLRTTVSGEATLSLSGASVAISGDATVRVNAPAISFGV